MPFGALQIQFMLPAFALVLFRVAGLFVTAPLLGSSVIPARIKIAMIMTLSFLMFPAVMGTIPQEVTVQTALVGVVGEMLIGLIIGVAASLIITGVQVAGTLIGQQAGIALASAFDPTINESTSIMSQMFAMVMTLAFLAVGGHRVMIATLLDTFTVVPVLGFAMHTDFLELIANLLSAAFILAIRMFSPVLIALMLATLTMGFLSRTMPQLNILSVGFAIRGLISMAVAGLTLAACGDLIVDVMMYMMNEVRAAFALPPVIF